jgi:hypothetical protein
MEPPVEVCETSSPVHITCPGTIIQMTDPRLSPMERHAPHAHESKEHCKESARIRSPHMPPCPRDSVQGCNCTRDTAGTTTT